MVIKAGDGIPASAFMWMGPDSETDVRHGSSDDIFKGRKVVVFGLPGAFTPVCSAEHLPGFVKIADDLFAKGVDTIVCISVNDPFVMAAWAKAQGVSDKIMMLCDPKAEFTDAIGLKLDLGDFGLGERSERYSMLVDDGVVTVVNVEASAIACDLSSANTLLEQV